MNRPSKTIVGGIAGMILSSLLVVVVFAVVYNYLQFNEARVLSDKRHTYIGPDDGSLMLAIPAAFVTSILTAVPFSFLTAFACFRRIRHMGVSILGIAVTGISLSIASIALSVAILFHCPLYPGARNATGCSPSKEYNKADQPPAGDRGPATPEE